MVYWNFFCSLRPLMLRIFTTLSVLLFAFASFSQTPVIPCITDEIYAETLKNDPAAAQRLQSAQDAWKQHRHLPGLKSGNTYKIPVVVHVIHTYGPENISKAQIDDQIRILNEDFRRLNADRTNTRKVFESVAADMGYEFVLATKDPQGRCTDGVVRVFSPLTNNARDNVKALSVWDSRRYLNVWLVKTIEKSDPDEPGIVLGFAQFPWERSSRPNTDGIVVRADYFGSIGTANGNNNFGRVATHEIGHWLGLFHPFQGGCNPTPPWGEDIADTPPVASPSFGCNLNANTCAEVSDKPDQIENYMDYADGRCQNMYTIGQRARADVMVSNYRSFMFTTENQNFTGINVNPRPTCAPIADMPFEPIITCTGQAISLQSTTFGGPPTSYNWQMPGGTPSSSTLPSPSVSYNTPGRYDITLNVSNAAGSSTIVRKLKVMVNPSPGQMPLPANFDFEAPNFPYSGWVVFANDTNWKWTRSNVASAGGSHSLLLRINDKGPDGDISSLTLPAIDLRGIGAPQLVFSAANARRNGSVDRLRLMASTDCGATWFQFFQRAGSSLSSAPDFSGTNFIPTKDQWRTHTAALTSLAGRQDVLIRFDGQANAGNNIYIDNIIISSATSLLSPREATFAIYPNPSKGFIEFSLDNAGNEEINFELYTIAGMPVFAKKILPVGNTFQLYLPEELSAGVYLARLTIGGETKTARVVLSK